MALSAVISCNQGLAFFSMKVIARPFRFVGGAVLRPFGQLLIAHPISLLILAQQAA